MSDSDDAYGPPLPPGFGSGSKPAKRAASSDSEDSYGACGPSLPPDFKKQRVDSGSIGPALPPHLQQKHSGDRRSGQSSSKSGKAVIGPALPPHLMQSARDSEEDDSEDDSYGPSLPGQMRQPQRRQSDSSEEESYGPALPSSASQSRPGGAKSGSSVIGPTLPPHLGKPSNDSSDDDDDDDDPGIGPKLPSHLRKRIGGGSGSQAGTSARSGEIGPVLPPYLRSYARDDEDDDVVGPSPAEMFTGSEADYVAAQVERRAQKMKDKLSNKDVEGPIQRESWMTELPPEMSGHIGLTARTFRKHSRPENADRSVWTDTPADRARKEREAAEGGETSAPKKSALEVAINEKDKKYSEMINDYNKSKRGESLMEMHHKEKKKKKKKDKDKEKPKERRPFDRDVDLQVNRFDDAQRKVLIKKAQGFNSRFQAGKTTSHFL